MAKAKAAAGAKAKANKSTIVINKKTLDKNLLEAAKKAVAGQGDGRISKDDAVKLMDIIQKDGLYSDLERTTVAFLRRVYKWTESADKWFGEELKKFAAGKMKAKS